MTSPDTIIINTQSIDEFFIDDIKDEESEVGPSNGPSLLRDASLAVAEASELQARATDRTAASSYPRWYDGGGAPRHLLVPRQDDPDMWAVRVKVCTLSITLYLSDVI